MVPVTETVQLIVVGQLTLKVSMLFKEFTQVVVEVEQSIIGYTPFVPTRYELEVSRLFVQVVLPPHNIEMAFVPLIVLIQVGVPIQLIT